MTDDSANPPLDRRPRIVGSLVDLDDADQPLLLAIGKVVIAAAGLEKAMQVDLVRLLCEQQHDECAPSVSELERQLTRLNKLPGGELLKQLRTLAIPSDLADRIDEAIRRRNLLVHHLFEDAELAKAIIDGDEIGSVVERFERLALDCAELAVELQLFALPRLEAVLGVTRDGMVEMIKAMDPSAIPDGDDREQLKALQALTGLDGLAGALDELDATRVPRPSRGTADVSGC